MPVVGPADVARLFEVDVSYIHQLAKEGMPQVKRGQYELGACMLWYIKYLQKKLKARRPEGDQRANTERDERLKLLQAEAELKQLELARERGEFAAIADFEKSITEMVVATKARILALPSRLAPQLVGEDRLVIETRLEKELKDTLATLSKNGHNG
jgi:phage terminase Nu1 subunit (DNA packaging protein)